MGLQLQRKFQDEKSSFQAKYQRTISNIIDDDQILKATSDLDAEKSAMKAKQDEELRLFDTSVIQQLDQKVMDQQQTLERAGVPGFCVTNNPTEVQLQLYLIEFIRRLDPRNANANVWDGKKLS